MTNHPSEEESNMHNQTPQNHATRPTNHQTDTRPQSGRSRVRAYAHWGEVLAMGVGLAVWVGFVYGVLAFAGMFR